ncbi:hypothetical protein CEXT_449501 [Caerostris extrusa]|uniref:Uncharacterized protein n=1 Tax=Caerostris extrusa TaxID=172846 RepID=A0AAV4YAK1_CAEEX|nr:hypothetical protein CEXT_449501 [Caerostris extrusa]
MQQNEKHLLGVRRKLVLKLHLFFGLEPLKINTRDEGVAEKNIIQNKRSKETNVRKVGKAFAEQLIRSCEHPVADDGQASFHVGHPWFALLLRQKQCN